MKKFLLSLALIAGMTSYATADVVTFDITEAAANATIVGTHVDEDLTGTTNVYEQYNPLTSFSYLGFDFTFAQNESATAPALYSSKNGTWTLRLYKGKTTDVPGNTMTIAAPADATISKIVFNNSDAKGVVNVDKGTVANEASSIVWKGEAADVTFDVVANFRINSIEIEYTAGAEATPSFSTLAALNEAGLNPGDAFIFNGEVTINGFALPDDGYTEFSQRYAFVQDETGVAQLRVPADVDILYTAGDRISGFEGKYIPFIYTTYDWEIDEEYDVTVVAYLMTSFPAATPGTPYAPEEVAEIDESMQARYVKATNQYIEDYGGVYGIDVVEGQSWPVYGFGVDMAEVVPTWDVWTDAVNYFSIEGFVGGEPEWGRGFYLTKAEAMKTTDLVYLAEGSLEFEGSTEVVLACDAAASDLTPCMIWWRLIAENGAETRAEEGFEMYDGEPIVVTESCIIEAYAQVLGYLPGDVQEFNFTKQINVGIDGIAADRNLKVYNLQGVEVSADNLPTGIYIINGKKVNIRK